MNKLLLGRILTALGFVLLLLGPFVIVGLFQQFWGFWLGLAGAAIETYGYITWLWNSPA